MKTQSNHTPGPWTHGRMNLGNSLDRRSGFVVNGPDVEPLPVRICDIRCAPEAPFATSEANARLISAAPDLLAAAQEFVRRVEAGEIRSKTAYGLFKAAIEKATGKGETL